MKKKLIHFAIFICFPYISYSQTQELSDLQVTNAPGLILLDETPSSIDKPIDPKTFAISLYNLTQGGSLECTPYWFFNHKDYTFKKHLENKTPILQTLNFSLSHISKVSDDHALAAGIRTQLFRAYHKNNVQEIKSLYNEMQDELIEDNLDWEKINGISDEMNTLKARTKWTVELAGAFAYHFLNANYQAYDFQKAGAWLNLKYTPSLKSNTDIVFLARYLYADSIVSKSSVFDLGTAIYYNKNKFEGEVEYVFRYDFIPKKSYDRLSFMLTYKLSNKIAIVSSLGKNFNATKNIISVLGIKFGISGLSLDDSITEN
ncbi:MAG: hypothetical protein R2831_01690 [Chitinophagaceae bacterium]